MEYSTFLFGKQGRVTPSAATGCQTKTSFGFRAWCVVLTFIVGAGIAGCNDGDTEESSADVGSDDSGGSVPIVPADFLTKYTEVRDCRFSIEHDSINIRVFATPAAAAAYVDGEYPFPVGTVLAKAEYDDSSCTDLVGITAMRRLETGASPATGDWEWQRLDPNLLPISVDQKACAACHTACTEGRDMACTNP